MASTPGLEPGPHWWEASALTTTLPLLPRLFSERYSLSIYWPFLLSGEVEWKTAIQGRSQSVQQRQGTFLSLSGHLSQVSTVTIPPPSPPCSFSASSCPLSKEEILDSGHLKFL